MSKTTRRNAKKIIAECKRIGKFQKWTRRRTRNVAKMAIMCASVESGLHIYASYNVPESREYPYDEGYIGSDHFSVGLFQQQTPMWGSCKDCMDPYHSTRKFVRRLIERGLVSTPDNAYEMGRAVQDVQGSEFPTRYQGKFEHAHEILRRHFLTTRPAKSIK